MNFELWHVIVVLIIAGWSIICLFKYTERRRQQRLERENNRVSTHSGPIIYEPNARFGEPYFSPTSAMCKFCTWPSIMRCDLLDDTSVHIEYCANCKAIHQ